MVKEIQKSEPKTEHLTSPDQITELAKQISRIIPEDERMLHDYLFLEDYPRLLKSSISKFPPFSVLSIEEIIPNKQTGTFSKLRIAKKILMPEFEKRFKNVEAPTIELDLKSLEQLDQNRKFRILSVILEWEKRTGLKVRFDGVVGKGKQEAGPTINSIEEDKEKNIEISPIADEDSSENKLANLLEKYKNYQQWLAGAGAHSYHGKFYRKEILKLTQTIIIETINHNTEDIGFTYQDLIETCKEILELSEEKILLEIIDIGQTTEGLDASLEEIVIAGTMSLAGQIGLGNYA